VWEREERENGRWESWETVYERERVEGGERAWDIVKWRERERDERDRRRREREGGWENFEAHFLPFCVLLSELVGHKKKDEIS
jgi:hypothetical protein